MGKCGREGGEGSGTVEEGGLVLTGAARGGTAGWKGGVRAVRSELLGGLKI